MAALAQVIRSDPAFVGRLIKAANGIIGYGRRPIVSVQDALTILGMPAVRNMALGFSLLNHYRSGACEGFDYARYWSHSLLTAVATQAITLRTRVAAPDETYCLGLLGRVGELALATLYPHDYTKILGDVQNDPLRLAELESRAFAMTNAELGAAMLADWGLPRLFTDSAFCTASGVECLQPEGSRDATLTLTLRLARQLGDLCLAPENERAAHLHRVKLAGSRLSFDEETLTTLSDGVFAEWLEWSALLNLHAEKLPPFEHMLKEAEKPVAPDVVQSPPVEKNVPAGVVEDSESDGQGERLLRVLIVEGDKSVRAMLRDALINGGYDVAEAGDGYMATEMALDFRPDMMLLASMLVDISGADLLRTLRKTRIGRAIYVVVMGDDAAEETVISAFDAGADDLLPKPINTRLLLAKIRAGRRLTALHYEIERDREEIRHFAAELAVSNRRLQEVALMDPLTGCPNRRFFTDRIAQEWAAAVRSARPLSCLMLDIDNFKVINDTYGHDVGDSVLRQVAASIRSALRGHDLVARTGGDEFIVLCPDTTIEAAMVCAERVRSGVEDAQVLSGLLHLKVTISVGVASRDQSVVDADSLLKRADQGLYIAKQGGRNQTAAVQLKPHIAGVA